MSPVARRHAELLREIGLAQSSRPGTFEAILELVEPLPRGRALDAPSGPGLLSEALRRLGFEVTAADLSPEVFVPRERIPFRILDLDRPFPIEDASFDLVVCGDGIEHLENPFACFREFARVLARGGVLVVATPNYSSLARRLRFLRTGSLVRALDRPVAHDAGPKADRGHLNPLDLVRMAWMAEAAGLELQRVVTLLPKRRYYALAPLALGVLAYAATLGARERRNLYAEHALTWRVLLGGRKLVALFRKSSA